MKEKNNALNTRQWGQIREDIVRGVVICQKEMLNMEEAVLLTGLSRNYIYKLTARREIPHYKPLGRAIYFRRVELEEWLKRGRVETSAELGDVAKQYTLMNPLPFGPAQRHTKGAKRS